MSRFERTGEVLARIDRAISRPIYFFTDRIGRITRLYLQTRLGRLLQWLLTRVLTWYVIGVIVTWLGYHEFADRITTRQDAALLAAMAFVLFECLIGTILSTEYFRLRVLGLISFLAGGSLLYFIVGDGVYRIIPSITGRPEAVEFVRSFFLVTTVALGITYNRYLWRNRKNPPAWWGKDQRNPGRKWHRDFFD